MPLVLNNNVAALTAQHNLGKTSSMLAKSLERLSSGLRINRGADGPAALVISEQQRAQIAGLQKAIENTEKGVTLVQTAEGALNEINSLLVKVRGLALDSANSAVNDANALAANQAEVKNALETIDRIAVNTQFGTKVLLDGSAGFTGSTDDTDVSFVTATTSSPTGAFAINVTTSAQRAYVTAGTGQRTNLAAAETLTVNGVLVSLSAGLTQAQVVSRINEFTGQTSVVAESYRVGQAADTAFTVSSAAATTASTLNSLDQNSVDYTAGATIAISGFEADGTTAVTGNFTFGAANDGTTLGDLVNRISALFTTATATLDSSGRIVLTADTLTGTTSVAPSIAIAAGTGTGTTTFPTFSNLNATRLRTNQYGAAAEVRVQSNVAASTTSSGFGTTQVTDLGVDVAGTIGGFAASGKGNVLTGTTGAGAAGISVSLNGLLANSTVATVTGAQGNVTVQDFSLVFQIGPNANQIAKVAIDKAKTDALGLNVAGSQFANLAAIDVSSASGAQAAISVVDAAINGITTMRGRLGAFQQNTLESTANNLRSTLENTVAAESVIRDTDFAKETTNSTKQQILLQAGTSVLGSANLVPQVVLSLLQG